MELAAGNLTQRRPRARRKGPDDRPRDADLERAAARGRLGGLHELRPELRLDRAGLCRPGDRRPFTARVVELTGRITRRNPLDPGTDVGPMTTSGQRDVVEDHLRDAREKGRPGPVRGRAQPDLPGLFPDPRRPRRRRSPMKIMTEETFGPVLPIMPFRPGRSRLALANDCVYGLTASVWTRNRRPPPARRAPRGRHRDGQRPHVLVHRAPGDLGRRSSRRGWAVRTGPTGSCIISRTSSS